MAAKIFHDAFEAARSESRRRDQAAAVEATNSGIGASLLEAAHVQLTALKAENGRLTDLVASLQGDLATARESSARAETAAAHVEAASARAEARAEAERARADQHAVARRAADDATQRERELRIIAESKPPQIIREPAQVIAALPVPAPPAPVLPEPPKKLRMHIKARDPNGLITDVDWIPGD